MSFSLDGGANTIQDKHTQEQLKDLQSLRLDLKVMLTEERIKEFYEELDGNAYLSFSGGKDSTVLLDIARKRYPEIPAVFSNTGLEYPEIRRFAKAHDNVEVVQPKTPFNEVISRYGYPLIGKEVAEAIYYARKIRSQDVQVERERARGRASDSDERFTQPQDNSDGCVPTSRTTAHHRREFHGEREREREKRGRTQQQNGRNSRGRETTAKRQDEPG